MSDLPGLASILDGIEPVAGHRPWPRYPVGAAAWQALAASLAGGRLELVGLWGDPPLVHMALRDPPAGTLAVASIDASTGRFPSVGRVHPPAIRLERTVYDLFGLLPEGAADDRPWLDHGQWPLVQPMGPATPHRPAFSAYAFLPVEGPGLHQIPVGPVHAGIIEPGHFRFTANGETVVRLEQRLGWVHKGIERRLVGTPVDEAARIVGRVSGDSTVAYAFGFARAVEAALGVEAPPRAHALRGVMAELERVANHLGDVGAICNDAAFAVMLAHCGYLREQVLQAADACFGHRLMMDRVVPGGVAADLDDAGRRQLAALVQGTRTRFARLVDLYDSTPSLQDRTVSTGRVDGALVRQWAAGGHVGRASGRDFDGRRAVPYPPYDRLSFEVPVLEAGDVDARVWIRIREIGQSLGLIEQLLDALPGGPLRTALAPPPRSAEGMALVEAFRGDLLVWLRLSPGLCIERCHPRDASWFQWPLLEVAVEGNIVADFPLCNKSFNCSYSGHDL
ncbi:MAG: NADH-quinone oxidoreductase subunit C [Geminicoccaceae bacterium]